MTAATLGLTTDVKRAFCQLNGKEDAKLWVYFNGAHERVASWRNGNLVKAVCTPFQNGDTRGLLVTEVLGSSPVVGVQELRREPGTPRLRVIK